MITKAKNLGSFLRAAVWLTTVLILTSLQPASATDFPGPDAFGYVATMIPGTLRDVSATGTFVLLSDDQVSGAISIPFPFQFYGVAVTELFISSNGFVTFTATGNAGCCSGQLIPSPSGPNNLIAGFWEDLNAPAGNIRYALHGTVGPPGDRQFVVGFYSISHYFDGPRVTFEIILHEKGSAIELQYGAAPSDGGTHTVGIENADGTIGLQIARGNVSFNNQGFFILIGTFEELKVARAEASFRDEPRPDKYYVRGKFILSEFSNGVDLAAEPVVVMVGTSTLTIPAGSFKLKKHGRRAEFEGQVDGVSVDARIEATGPRSFNYRVRAKGVDLTDSAIPIDFGLRIGADDFGSTTIPLRGELKFREEHHHGHDHDDD
jgi:hypothetical protein